MKFLLRLTRAFSAVHYQNLKLNYSALRTYQSKIIPLGSSQQLPFSSQTCSVISYFQYSTTSSSVEQISQTEEPSGLQASSDSVQKANETSLSEVVKKLYDTIEKEIKKNNSSARLQHKTECEKILELLLKYKISEEDVSNILIGVPKLLTFPHSVWEETVKQLLRNYKFEPRQLLPLLGDSPQILEGSAWKSINELFMVLRSWGVREGMMQLVVLQHPDLMWRNNKSVLVNYANLCGVFIKSNVLSLIVSQPNVLTDEWEKTQAKITYVFEKMGFKGPDIVKSKLFKHSLEHIIIRHEFLERAGLFSKPDKHGVSKTENAPLRNIMDSDDKAFAKLVAGLTLEEFLVFVDLKQQEFEEADEAEDTDIEEEF